MVRTESEVPLDEALGMLIDGDSACKACPSSPDTRAFFTSSLEKTSIGTALSKTLRSLAREPKTVMVSRPSEAEGEVSSASVLAVSAIDAQATKIIRMCTGVSPVCRYRYNSDTA